MYPIDRYVDQLEEIAAAKRAIDGALQVSVTLIAGVPEGYDGTMVYSSDPEYDDLFGVGPLVGDAGQKDDGNQTTHAAQDDNGNHGCDKVPHQREGDQFMVGLVQDFAAPQHYADEFGAQGTQVNEETHEETQNQRAALEMSQRGHVEALLCGVSCLSGLVVRHGVVHSSGSES